jgi:hypothetical protein
MHDLKAIHSALKREEYEKVLSLGNKVLNEDPDSPEVLYLVGAALRQIGHLGLAYCALSRAIAKEQKQVNLWMYYAATLHDLNRWDAAEKAFQHAHKMVPNDPVPPANIAATYVQRGMWRDAINWGNKALKLDNDIYIGKVSLGFAHLSLGRWEDAWKYSEAIYGNHLQIRLYNPPETREGRWDGTPDKTVVVQCDQGVGDIIMFSQCLPRMQKVCKEVIVECAPRMVGMFKRNFPGVFVYGSLKEDQVEWLDNHKIDASTHISFLGRWYLNNDSDFERKAYIASDQQLKQKWLTWLEKYSKPWRGIAWKGGIQQTQTHLRSVSLDKMEPIMKGAGSVFDLSYHDSNDEVARWNINLKQQVIRPPIDVKNYDDTIAFIDALDEVASVTTTVAHVCGALGKKAHILVPEVAQWRYAYKFNDGTEMIWYPKDSVKLYRQKPGEKTWDHAIKRLADDL